MNAVLVVSPQRAYVEQARMWIERLDRGEARLLKSGRFASLRQGR
jgi:hypothetical protein